MRVWVDATARTRTVTTGWRRVFGVRVTIDSGLQARCTAHDHRITTSGGLGTGSGVVACGQIGGTAVLVDRHVC